MFDRSLLSQSQVNVQSPLPTFIELYISDTIQASLGNAFRYLHTLLAEHSTLAARLLPISSELSCALDTALEYMLIFHANTTFAEALFGLRRASIAHPSSHTDLNQPRLSWLLCGPQPMSSFSSKDSDASPMNDFTAAEVHSGANSDYGHLRFGVMTRRQRLVTLFMVSIKPYLQTKLSEWYVGHVEESMDAVAARESYRRRHPLRARLLDLLAKLYPYLHVIVESSSFLYKILYILEKSPYASPLGRLFGVVVRRATGEDMLSSKNPRAERALATATGIAVALFLGFRLLELRALSSNRGPRHGATLGSSQLDKTIPPPPKLGVHIPLPAEAALPEAGMCPICNRKVTNAAVNCASGIVCCYACLNEYVSAHEKCPVTQLATNSSQIRRIYEA